MFPEWVNLVFSFLSVEHCIMYCCKLWSALSQRQGAMEMPKIIYYIIINLHRWACKTYCNTTKWSFLYFFCRFTWTRPCCMRPRDRWPQPVFVHSPGILHTHHMQMQLHFPTCISPVWSPPDLQGVSSCPWGLRRVSWQRCVPWAFRWCFTL